MSEARLAVEAQPLVASGAAALGWAATAVFAASYFLPPRALKRVQMAGALMWVSYGALTHSWPVVAANVLVFAAAAWTARTGAPAA